MTLLGGYKSVIFDMDGVIVDSEPRHERAFYAVLEEVGYDRRLSLKFADYVGRTDRVLWEDFVVRHQPAQSLEQLLAMKRQKVVQILREERPLFDGITELIKDLAKQVPLGLASGSERPIVDEVLKLAQLHPCFRCVVTGSDVPQGKPEPDIFLRTAADLGVAPADCVVIEDSRPGVAAALKAGMRVVAVTNTHPAEELCDATRVVGGVPALRALLLKGADTGS